MFQQQSVKQSSKGHQLICTVGLGMESAAGGEICSRLYLKRVNVWWGSPRRSLRLLSGISETTILPVLQLNRRSVKWYSALIVRD